MVQKYHPIFLDDFRKSSDRPGHKFRNIFQNSPVFFSCVGEAPDTEFLVVIFFEAFPSQYQRKTVEVLDGKT